MTQDIVVIVWSAIYLGNIEQVFFSFEARTKTSLSGGWICHPTIKNFFSRFYAIVSLDLFVIYYKKFMHKYIPD